MGWWLTFIEAIELRPGIKPMNFYVRCLLVLAAAIAGVGSVVGRPESINPSLDQIGSTTAIQLTADPGGFSHSIPDAIDSAAWDANDGQREDNFLLRHFEIQLASGLKKPKPNDEVEQVPTEFGWPRWLVRSPKLNRKFLLASSQQSSLLTLGIRLQL